MANYDFATIVQQMAAQENIQNCQLKEISASQKGDGYTGTVKAVQLIGTNKILDVVFKYSHRNPSIHKELPINKMYQREMHFYEEIAPLFADFLSEHNIKNRFDNFPIYYRGIKDPRNELLVMENLRTQNYDLWDRKQLMNKEHLEYALGTFAKLHGTSFAMQKLNPTLYTKISADLINYDLFKECYKLMDFPGSFRKSVEEILPDFDPITDKLYIEKLKAFAVKAKDELTNVIDYSGHNVILQGDCWCTNAMYQYHNLSDRGKPMNMKLLDWQLVRVAPPCWDLAYFFYTISPKEFLDDLDYFLNFYYEALARYLMQFGLKVEDIYTKSSFLKDWAAQSKYGFMVNFTVRKAMMSDSQDTPDLAEDFKDFMSSFRLKEDQTKVYTQQMKEIVMHFVDKQFI